MLSLTDIVNAGVAAYQASRPAYDFELADAITRADVEPTAPNNLGIVDEDRQRALCLSCPLADCVDVTDARCPIRQEQRRVWRAKR